ncbi:MAG: type 1 glutamine amidotransferase [Microthrixaceae bacterium]
MTQPTQLRLVVIEHETDAGLGRMAPHLVGHRVTTVRPTTGEDMPSLRGIDGVIILGGSMGAYEERAHPWMSDEKAWAAAAVGADVPVLGICLGSQLLADALGGRAYRSERTLEAGVLPLHLTEAGAADPVLSQAGDRVFAMHGDTFDLPPGATLLAHTDDYLASFRVGSALAVQFHPETPADGAIGWATGGEQHLLEGARVDQAQFARQLRAEDSYLAERADALFAAWLDGLASG